jgi:hypothetical protein
MVAGSARSARSARLGRMVARWRARRHDRAPDLPTNGVDATVLATAAGLVISPSMVLPVPP